MREILVYPALELAFLLLFCSNMRRRRPSLPGIACAAACTLLYIGLRRFFIGNFDAVILVSRVFYLTAFCAALYDVPLPVAAFLCACLSLMLHAVILFYYNLPFLSHLTKRWPLADALLINLLRGVIVLCLRKTAAEAARARIELIEYLLVLISYLGYIVDISSSISAISVRASTLEASAVLFMYCLATILSVVAALWHVVTRTRQAEALHMQSVLDQQYATWNQKTERDAAIARMYHDIRHQIGLIGSLNSADSRELIDALRQSADQYAPFCDTGSPILSTLLGEKARRCAQQQIAFHCVTQLDSLAPLEGLDLCAIVSNALDNAIEASERLESPARREISVRLIRRDAFLVFRFENAYDGVLRAEQGRLLSLKPNPQEHGIGLRSIEACVHKYGGDMVMQTDGGRFVLKIVIPCA